MCVRQYGYRGEEEEKKRGWAETNLFNDKLGSLGILLSNLFLLDGGSELLSETIRYGDTRSVSGIRPGCIRRLEFPLWMLLTSCASRVT